MSCGLEVEKGKSSFSVIILNLSCRKWNLKNGENLGEWNEMRIERNINRGKLDQRVNKPKPYTWRNLKFNLGLWMKGIED